MLELLFAGGIILSVILLVFLFKAFLPLLLFPIKAGFWLLGAVLQLLFLPFQLVGGLVLAIVLIPLIVIALPVLLGIGVPLVLLALGAVAMWLFVAFVCWVGSLLFGWC